MKKASELIAEIQALIEEHGDLPVIDEDELETMIELNDDGDEPVFVVT